MWSEGVQDDRLMTLVHGKLVALNVDPIEKKTLYHFLARSLAHSIATVGCNFRCLHCQNADIFQSPKEMENIVGEFVPPEQVIAAARGTKCQSIAYTYTVSTVFFEYVYDVAVSAHDSGLKNIFVSNGYIGDEAAKKIMPSWMVLTLTLEEMISFIGRFAEPD